MKKSELRTGMIVENRYGNEFLVMLNTKSNNDMLMSLNRGGISMLDWFKEDLTDALSDRHLDIVKVSTTPTKCFDLNNRTIIWERKEEVKEHTIEELIEKVGYEFKIKK